MKAFKMFQPTNDDVFTLNWCTTTSSITSSTTSPLQHGNAPSVRRLFDFDPITEGQESVFGFLKSPALIETLGESVRFT